jgi:hypothetical protein
LDTPLPFGVSAAVFRQEVAVYERALKAALLNEYREIFLVTAVICVVGAVLAALIGRHRASPG